MPDAELGNLLDKALGTERLFLERLYFVTRPTKLSGMDSRTANSLMDAYARDADLVGDAQAMAKALDKLAVGRPGSLVSTAHLLALLGRRPEWKAHLAVLDTNPPRASANANAPLAAADAGGGGGGSGSGGEGQPNPGAP